MIIITYTKNIVTSKLCKMLYKNIKKLLHFIPDGSWVGTLQFTGEMGGAVFLKESLEKRRVLSEVFSSLASVTFFWSKSVTTQEYLTVQVPYKL